MRLVLASLPLLGLVGCGYVGDPLPPALHIPKPVLDLRVVQRGPHLEAAFTMPVATGEGLPVEKAGRIDLRVGPAPAPPFDMNSWLAGTREIFVEWPDLPATPPTASAAVGHTVTQVFDAQDWTGKDVILGVRLSSPSGRFSVMSNLVAISVIPPLTAPAFTAESRADGILLKWTALPQPGTHYRITRKIGAGAAQTIADLAETQYLDLVTAFGPTYTYSLQSYARAGDINAVSEPSAPFAVAHTDHFPPTVPTGLAVIAGAKTIDLGWDRNTDADLAGYRIYRAVGDGPFVRIPGEVEPPSFRDAQVQTGQRYRYAITAVDRLGNESGRSEPAEAEAP
jgi:hypothetical protein